MADEKGRDIRCKKLRKFREQMLSRENKSKPYQGINFLCADQNKEMTSCWGIF